jgi:hypothetical protein
LLSLAAQTAQSSPDSQFPSHSSVNSKLLFLVDAQLPINFSPTSHSEYLYDRSHFSNNSQSLRWGKTKPFEEGSSPEILKYPTHQTQPLQDCNWRVAFRTQICFVVVSENAQNLFNSTPASVCPLAQNSF